LKTVENINTKEKKCVEIVRQIIKPNMITIDIGACLGFYTMVFADIVGDGGKVYAIEPIPNNVLKIKELIAINKFNNIIVDQCAIGNSNEKIKLLAHKTLPWMGHIDDVKLSKEGHNRNPFFYAAIDVEMCTLNHFQEKHNIKNIDFLKIDVEGGEVILFDGMTKALEQKQITIFLEVHFCFIADCKKDIPKLLETLTRYGLKVSHLIDKSHTAYMVKDNNIIEDVMKHSNKDIIYLFLKK